MTDKPPMFTGRAALPFDAVEAVRALGACDRRMARLIEKVGPFELRPSKSHTPFAALSQSIIYQQLSGKAAATIAGRFKALHPGRGYPKPELVLDTPDEALRGAGLSRAKVLAVQDLARRVLDGTVPSWAGLRKMPEEEIIERLTQVRGVGRWTAEMLLIFSLARPDVLPVNDLGVRKGFAIAYGKKEPPAPAALLEHGERWRPYRTVASWYLWRANDL